MTRTPPVLAAGDQLEPCTIGPVTITDIVRFAGAGGDFNPLHHDEEYARAAGLPGIIAMGQMQAGMLASWVSDIAGVENLLSYAVRFTSPLAVGETLTLRGTVTSVDDGIASVDLSAAVAERVVISGTARVRTQL
jgi:acyl dehydratase